VGDLEDLVGATGRRGTTAEERRAQAVERIRFWTGKRDEARANKTRVDLVNCDAKIIYWANRLRSLEERMAQVRHEVT
jgi:hypothetical protein